ncbi:MAG: hypothetical protein J0M12_09300 [Deltaproteobacteria bacterium]|nr:hypothetical protein [Deltaproteobacteria bacterium]
MAAFTTAFEISSLNGGLIEGTSRRSPGTSFNPQPARICHILLKECDERRTEVLVAALLVPSNASLPLPISLAAASEILGAARAFLRKHEPSSAEGERVALAHHLDILRHLHLTESSREESSALFNGSQNLLAACTHRAENERLVVLIQTWLERAVARGLVA